ncbi:hypothetical protein [Streptomyces sp. SCSIO ZS0520]|uniref:hypothetical protein n=1 Tax=Streptomyces sp. SCSIO ZS0520 TaxID=2892996 RepID=UPI0021D83E02|nr:hypothetical protein [Streptomyces sp. SCSIO ZS0520]
MGEDGTTVMVARKGHMSEELLDALNRSLEHLIETGLWVPGVTAAPAAEGDPRG